MLKPKDHFHGSDLEKVEQIYGIKKDEIISFSANVNPLGISYKLKDTLSAQLDAITTYPDREYTALRQTIADYVDAHLDTIIVGNGTSELISLFIQTRQPKKALILGPTYSEYEREITLSGGSTIYYPLKEEDDFQIHVHPFCDTLTDDLDLLVLCNPNNPTSTAIPQKDMRKILDCCMQHGIFVMVDETYVEFAPEEKNITSIALTHYYTNLIVLRGTSKFFASPGLRLGYAVTGNSDLRKAIHTRQNPWTINSLAEIAGRLMFEDYTYMEQTRTLIHQERERIFEIMNTWAGIKVFYPHGNFMLVKLEKQNLTSDQVFEHCIKKGLMIRDCSTFPFLDNKYIRFCFMKPEANDRLLLAIKELL